MSENNGSFAGSRQVLKQSTGNDWCPAGHERGSGNNPRGSGEHDTPKKKAKRIFAHQRKVRKWGGLLGSSPFSTNKTAA
jgi:hypothetical protein